MNQSLDLLFDNPYLKVILLLILFLAVVLIRLLFPRIKIKTEIDDLVDLARSMNCSEYDIFLKAGKKWNFSSDKIEEDFKRYLWHGDLPRYVKDYIKTQRT